MQTRVGGTWRGLGIILTIILTAVSGAISGAGGSYIIAIGALVIGALYLIVGFFRWIARM